MRGHHGTRQAGVSLIEVVVALFVLSIGMLGMAGLQMASLRANQSSYERSAAVLGAYTMIDRLRADVAAAQAGSYNIEFADDACDAPEGSSFADTQLAAWFGDLRTSVGPSACGAVSCTGGIAGSCVVSVRWDDSRARGASDQVFQIEARL
ncbi:MAG: type IV pilus modification protein PilV [Gammaproteobacteria bacterium]|jgi:type IV pilus assembly protein PilV|nr:type IV pilus modification protein PilV [Gammaproteobacteria bacterium]MBU0773386.1 type IV pilus modification protein PilV [Gammaproteobacteria bacterium]MBU0857410.1 type IV pilus modification protein PilV [Gammaproteobacteria bacterium]MBU1846873.1 type IV pilus modification protein PilV [Gammaproteobacteria bacterium]